MKPALPKLAEWSAKLEEERAKRRDELVEALTLEHGFVSRAAERLKISRQRVTVLVEELELGGLVAELRAKRRSLVK